MGLVYGTFSQLPLSKVSVTIASMARKLAFAALLSFATPAGAFAAAPLYDPVLLNVGLNCQWERTCQRRQLKAMASARKFMARAHPPLWRVHLCNRNAQRGTARIDWVGFNECIRNPDLPRPSRRSH